ncbi:MAG: hypothetical protein L0I80_01405 [Brevibacterium sp.]|uniref:hypothetical protein n=1 Tax=Brevibacterium sp. TaxID=1701 RepID=UPI0026470C59|nr:hypothetical protein [Brevibacterium sp.]MDN6534249.1 hypothetical protein [Yaniella sp.]MDN5807734.1 hypothetical protein [Brevibacterium sp.]MDN6122514.1 hypothetical protein [Brevibacterium sp.]MDN6134232.1 hypothetical protein [Brevibacterium sp.]MDN6158734.1 hypothetical protein [Brevibacterium sp.]
MNEKIDQSTEQSYYEVLEKWFDEERGAYEEWGVDPEGWEDYLDWLWEQREVRERAPSTVHGFYELPGTIAEFVRDRPFPSTPNGRFPYLLVMVVRAMNGGALPSRFSDRDSFESEYAELKGIAERANLLGDCEADA